MNETQYRQGPTIEREDTLTDEEQSISEYHSPPIYKAKEGSALTLAMLGGLTFVTFGPFGEIMSGLLTPVFAFILVLSCVYTTYACMLYKE